MLNMNVVTWTTGFKMATDPGQLFYPLPNQIVHGCHQDVGNELDEQEFCPENVKCDIPPIVPHFSRVQEILWLV